MTMMGRVWSAGTALVCVGVDADPVLAKRVELVLREGGELLGRLLGALTEGGLEHVPDFLCAVAEPDGVRVVLRGSFSVEVTTATGAPATIDGDGARTWREELIRGAVTVRPALGDLDMVWYPPTETDGDLHDQPVVLAASGPFADEDATLAEPGALPVTHEPADAVLEAPSRDDEEFDFSNLLDHTRYRDVEAAAVRVADELEPAPVAPTARSVDEDTIGPAGEPVPDADDEPAVRPTLLPVTGGLISGVPGMANDSPADVADDVADEIAAGVGEDDDGHTISIGELRRMQEAGGPAQQRHLSGVQALRCPAGHDNPPTAVHCRMCGVEITDRSVHLVARPVVARLRFSNGTIVELDKPQLIGRKPTVDASEVGEPPGLVTVPSPDGSISRVHLAVHVEGWEVLVEDTGSTNGTQIRLPGKDPERLREHEPRLVIPGTAVSISDSIEFTVEVPHP